MARLAEGIEHNLAHPSALAMVASAPDDPGRFVEDFCTWQHNPAYREVLCESALPAVSARLTGSLRFVAGTHAGTWYMPRTFRDQQARWFPDGTLAEGAMMDDPLFPIVWTAA